MCEGKAGLFGGFGAVAELVGIRWFSRHCHGSAITPDLVCRGAFPDFARYASAVSASSPRLHLQQGGCVGEGADTMAG